MANISINISTGTGTSVNMSCQVDDSEVLGQVNNIAGIVLAQIPSTTETAPATDPATSTTDTTSGTTTTTK